MAAGEHFKIIIVIIILIFLLGIWLLIHFGFLEFLAQNINSQSTFCDTFERTPLFGTIQCPK